jgi:GNAT superfamily N-acetyltransferase
VTFPRIRPAELRDLPDLLALYRELAGGRPGSLPADEATGRPILAEVLAQPGRLLFVAEHDGRLVGTADVLVTANLTHRGQPWAIVENVVVAAAHRRAGIGRELMIRAVEHAADAGCYKIQLLSRNDRTDAHRFYDALGFERSAAGYRRYLAD